MGEVGEFIKFVFGALAIGFGMLIVGLPFMMLGDYGAKLACQEKATIMQKEWHYSSLSKCMIKIDGSFVPLDSIVINKVR